METTKTRSESYFGPVLSAGLGPIFIRNGAGESSRGFSLEAGLGLWTRLAPTLNLRSSLVLSLHQLEGEPFRSKAQDPDPSLLSVGLRTGPFWSLNDSLSLGLHLGGGLSYFLGQGGSGNYVELGLGACILKDRLCAEGAGQLRSFFYPVRAERSPYPYPLDYQELSMGPALALKLSTYWDL